MHELNPFQRHYQALRLKKDEITRMILSGDPTYSHHFAPVPYVDPSTGESGRRIVGVYITSIENHMKMITAGAVCSASLDLAAECIVNATHRLSTPAEVAGWRQRQLDQKSYHDSQDARQKGSFKVELPAVEKVTK